MTADLARLDRAAGRAFEQSIADMMARGKFPPPVKWADADDATKAAWKSVTLAAIAEWERSA